MDTSITNLVVYIVYVINCNSVDYVAAVIQYIRSMHALRVV
jgi:hypothetical protein